MTEEEYLAAFVTLRDQLPRGSKFARRKKLRWWMLGRYSHVRLAWDGSIELPVSFDHTIQDYGPTPQEPVRSLVLQALEEMVTSSRASIAQGVHTRARRREAKMRKVTAAWLAGEGAQYANSDFCVCCDKILTDPESRARGIGPECWEHIVRHLEQARAALAKNEAAASKIPA